MVHATVALGLQGILKAKTDIERLAVPGLDGRGKRGLVYMRAVQLVLIRVAAGRKVKRADILHPRILLDACGVVAAVIPAKLTVVVQQADAVSDLAGLTDCHTEHVRRAPAKADSLDHERVVVRDCALAVEVNILFDQLGNAALGRALAREIRPNHAGHRIIRQIAAVVGNLDVIAQAVQNQGLPAVIIGAKLGLAMDIRVVAAARLVADDRHTLNGAFDIDRLRLGVADGNLIFARLVKAVRKLGSAGLTGSKLVFLAVNGLTIHLKLCDRCACVVADVDDICLDMQDIAGKVTDLAVAQLGTDIGVIICRSAVFDIDRRGHVSQLERMRAQLGHAQRAGQRLGRARLQGHNTVLKLVQVPHGTVVLDRDNCRRKAFAIVGHGRGYGHISVIKDRRRLDGNIRPAEHLLVGCQDGGIGKLGFLAFALRAVVLDGQDTFARLAGDVEEVALLIVCTRVLMGQVNRTRANLRIGGNRTRIAVRMARQEQIHVAWLDHVRDVTLGVGIRYRMMHEDDTEFRILCRVALQVGFEPIHRIADALDGTGIRLLPGGLRIHLEQAPRVGIHGDDMQIAVIERAVALNLCAIFLILHRINVGVEINAALVMVAAGVNDRVGMDKIIIHLCLKPEAELLGLRAGTLDNIAAVQHNVRVIILDRRVQLSAGRKDMRIRQRDNPDGLRVIAQRAEACLTAFAAVQLDLVIITGPRLKVFQLVVVKVHPLALKIGCVRVDLYRDGFRECIFISAIGNGCRNRFGAFPYDDHAVGLWSQQVRAVLENGACVIRRARSRGHSEYHNDCQQE